MPSWKSSGSPQDFDKRPNIPLPGPEDPWPRGSSPFKRGPPLHGTTGADATSVLAAIIHYKEEGYFAYIEYQPIFGFDAPAKVTTKQSDTAASGLGKSLSAAAEIVPSRYTHNSVPSPIPATNISQETSGVSSRLPEADHVNAVSECTESLERVSLSCGDPEVFSHPENNLRDSLLSEALGSDSPLGSPARESPRLDVFGDVTTNSGFVLGRNTRTLQIPTGKQQRGDETPSGSPDGFLVCTCGSPSSINFDWNDPESKVPAPGWEEIESYNQWMEDPAHSEWLWDQEREQWRLRNETNDDGSPIWFPMELD